MCACECVCVNVLFQMCAYICLWSVLEEGYQLHFRKDFSFCLILPVTFPVDNSS